MRTTLQTLEIQLEQLDESFWRAALANAVTGAFGSATFRFAGKVESAQDDSEDVVGATFPIMRFEGFDDLNDSSPSGKAAAERLHELDRSLRAAGWEPATPNGEHWWSLRYTRTSA